MNKINISITFSMTTVYYIKYTLYNIKIYNNLITITSTKIILLIIILYMKYSYPRHIPKLMDLKFSPNHTPIPILSSSTL